TAWIKPLVLPYLRGYRARKESSGGLEGIRLELPMPGKQGSLGFFVGYLAGAGEFAFLKPAPPELLIFAFVEPVGGPLHLAQVSELQAPLRWTSGYIRWLTHRPPRFEFYPGQPAALVRHTPVGDWPAAKREHLSRNFCIETLAWLVRSGLVRRWREFAANPGIAGR
ncbi:MAG: hypothetical protein ACRD5L_09050, partial [Bryobacteraceae bacterium]